MKQERDRGKATRSSLLLFKIEDPVWATFASAGRDGQSLLHGDDRRWEGILESRAEESKFLSVWVQLPSASVKHTPAGAARRALGYQREESQHKTSEGAEPPDLLRCPPVFLR